MDPKLLRTGGLAALALVVLAGLVGLVVLVVSASGEELPDAEPGAAGYLDLSCALVDGLDGVDGDALFDGPTGRHTADLQAAGSLMAAAARLDAEESGFATVGERLDRSRLSASPPDLRAQLDDAGARCAERGTGQVDEVTDAVRAAWSCAIAERLKEGGPLLEQLTTAPVAVPELIATAALGRLTEQAPYDATAEPADRMAAAYAGLDGADLDAALDDLLDACAGLA